MKRALCLWTVLLLSAVHAGCSAAPTRPDSIARGDYEGLARYLSALIRYEMKKQDVTGLSIALVDDQRVVWADGFGYADQAGKEPASPETVYRVASISKLFTSTAAMQLAERGKMDIDRPLRDYLPEFSIRTRFPGSAPVTPRTLMTHHSGLPSDYLKGMWTRHPEPFTAVVGRLREEYAANPPGTIFSYSNLGVTLLGLAVERIAGRDFAGHMQDCVILPLGMTRSSFSAGPDRSERAAKGYRNGRETEEYSLRDVPAGGLNSSVLDLSRFIRMVFAGGKAGDRRILEPGTLAEMLRPQNAGVPLDLGFRIGLGWMLGGLDGIDVRQTGTVARHSGATLLFHSQLIVLPERKLGVVVLSNSATSGSVVNKVATEALVLALEAKSGVRQPERKKPAESRERLSREALRDIEGRYATLAGVADIRDSSGGLRARAMGRTLRLFLREDGWLGLRYRFLGIFPVSLGELDDVGILRADVAGREILKARRHGREMLFGERIRPTPVSETWRRRTGEYEITNYGEDAPLVEKIRLLEEDGFLIAEYSMPLLFKGRIRFALDPVSDTEAIIRGMGRGMGETIRAFDIDGKTMYSCSGYLLRKKEK